jgi:dihydroorotate dehydrogenase (fumarate)
MNLQTTYLGLTLANPLVASASPLNSDLDNIRALEDSGAGAIVLPSIFAEQIEAEAARHEALSAVGASSSPEANGYFPAPDLYKVGPERYLELIRSARSAVAVPIIASLNASNGSDWEDYAIQIQEAGASALELNIYFVPGDITLSGRNVEQRYFDIIRAVKKRAVVPLARLSPGRWSEAITAAG